MKQNHYDLQGAWYCRGIAQVQGSFPDYVLIFVESVNLIESRSSFFPEKKSWREKARSKKP